jgi:hypothetical protein
VVADFLLLFHSFPFRIKIKMLRMVKTAGLPDKKNHVIMNAMDMKMLGHQNATAVDLDLDLLLEVGMLVILLQTVVAMAQNLIMSEAPLAEIMEGMIVADLAGLGGMTIASVALPVVVAQHRQDTVAEINGLVMITQLAKATLKVLKENHPPNLHHSNRIQCSAVPCSLEVSRKSVAYITSSLANFL